MDRPELPEVFPDAGPPRPASLFHPLFHVVLVEPEIPNNTGNIGRTCVALGAALHLVHPLGFEVSEKACRRAGLDYWPRLNLHEHQSWSDYLASPDRRAVAPLTTPRRWYLSTKATRLVFDADFRPGDHLIFGKETRGLPPELVQSAGDHALRLPMIAGERSLNLATAVCAVAYEAVRQCFVRGDLSTDSDGCFRMRKSH